MVSLRKATLEDAELVFEWRNAPETRKYFFNPDPIKKADHMNWFEQSLKMPCRCLLIAENNQEPVGVLRYDLCDNRAEIDIYVAPSLFGRGLGTQILLVGTGWIKANFPNIKILNANVIPENIASSRTFDKAGFHLKSLAYEKHL